MDQQNQGIGSLPSGTLESLAYNLNNVPPEDNQPATVNIGGHNILDVSKTNPLNRVGKSLQDLSSQYLKTRQVQKGRDFLKSVHEVMSQNMTPQERAQHLMDLKAQHGTDYGLGVEDMLKAANIEWKPQNMQEAITLERAKKGSTTDDLNFNTLPSLQIDASPADKQAFLMKLPGGTQELIKGLSDYSLDLNKITSLRGDQRQKLASLTKQYDPSFDMNQFNARKNFINNLANGPLSKSIVSANTLIGHINSLNDSYTDLHNSKIPMMNAVGNMVKKNTGNAGPTNLRTNAAAVADELESLFRNSGGSVEGIKEWRNNISDNASPEQSKAFVQKAVELMASRLQAIDSQYKNIMGKPKQFSVLNGKSQQILSKMGINPQQVEYSPETMATMPQPGQMPAAGGQPGGNNMLDMLGQQNPQVGQKIAQARQLGYNDDEILQYLNQGQ